MSEPSTAVIRSIEEDDIDACTAIFVKAYAEVYGEMWPVQAAEARITQVMEAGPRYCLVIERSCTEVIGFLLARPYPWYDGIRLWIEEIVIETRYRGVGWCRRLLGRLDEIALAEGIKGFSLIAREGSVADQLYRRLGYTPATWLHLERPGPRTDTARPI